MAGYGMIEMDWVKIEDGGDMPDKHEMVALCGNHHHERWWCQGIYAGGKQFFADSDMGRYEATHWMRIEFPGDGK